MADPLCSQDVDRSRERERSLGVVVMVESGKLEWLWDRAGDCGGVVGDVARKSVVCGGKCAVGSRRYWPGRPGGPGINWSNLRARIRRIVARPRATTLL